MKRYVIFLISVLFLSSLASAQYKINKNKYDYRTYSYQAGDPYNPIMAQQLSIIIPGLGQIYCKERGRGAAFLTASLGNDIILCAGILWLIGNRLEDIKSNFVPKSMAIGGGIGFFAIRFWSSADADRVARVNNLVSRDKNKTSYDLQIQPYINSNFYSETGSIPAGITLRVTF